MVKLLEREALVAQVPDQVLSSYARCSDASSKDRSSSDEDTPRSTGGISRSINVQSFPGNNTPASTQNT
jgi:hypothetical protein